MILLLGVALCTVEPLLAARRPDGHLGVQYMLAHPCGRQMLYVILVAFR